MAEFDIAQIDVEATQATTKGRYNSLVMIDSTHFIVAYTDTNGDGMIKTFSVDADGDNITQIAELEHDTTSCTYNSLVMIDSTHFMLAYDYNGDAGRLRTFSIDGNYENITTIDTLNHDTTKGVWNSLVKIDSTHFMLAYMGSSNNYGVVKTFSIDGSYSTIAQIDVLEHDTAYGAQNSLVKIDSTHFALAYETVTGTYSGVIKTFSIDGSYDTITQIDSLEHRDIPTRYNSLVMIDSTHFILAFSGEYNLDGIIKTFSIDGSYGTITQIDSFVHDTTIGEFSSLIQYDSTHYILACAGASRFGYIKTFSIDGSYDNIAEVNSLLHGGNIVGEDNSLIMLDTGILALAYSATSDYGWIKTFSVAGGTVANTTNFFNFL